MSKIQTIIDTVKELSVIELSELVKAFEEELKTDIIVDENGHLMGALGVAILSKQAPIKTNFNFKNDTFIINTK